MGALLGRNKNEERKGFFGYRICPRNSSKNQKNGTGKSEIKEEGKSTSQKLQWTEAQLQVPESLLEIEDQVINEPPVPPPRKKIKSNTLERKENVKLLMNADKVPEIQVDLVPVEEPIIIPKKEPVHICDGTHHHVTNIVNGKVIHNHCIHPKVVKQEVETVAVEKPAPVRPKFLSTVSLPDIDELKHNQNNTKAKNKDSRKKPQKQISVISLPTDSKITLSDTTSARLENYLRRCKNFNGLPPKQLLEELQLEDHHSDSDDSWDGLNDWGMNIIEYHGMPLKSPVEPRSRLDKPSARLQPKPVEETKKTVVDRLRDIAERRESIDDFFDAKAESLYPTNELKPNTQLGRRGSDSFFEGENDKEYHPVNPKDDSSKLKSDIFYTNALLESESRYFERPPVKLAKPEVKKEALPQTEQKKKGETKPPNGLDLNDRDLLETFQEFYDAHQNMKSPKKETPEVHEDTKPKRKLGNVEHSNLLKILQDNSKREDNSESGHSRSDIAEDKSRISNENNPKH